MSQETPTPAELQQQIAALQQQLQTLERQKATMHANIQDEGLSVQGQQNVTATKDSAAVGGDVDGPLILGDNNSVTTIRHIYQQAPGQPALDEDAFNEALRRYLLWVERCYGRLNLRGVEKREQQVLSLTLDDVYVSLAALVSPERRTQRQMEVVLHEERLVPVHMNRLLPLSPRLVISGAPGCGKTTYLHLIAATLAQAIRRNEVTAVHQHLGLSDPLPLPIVVALSDYNQYRRQHSQSADPRQGTLIAFISHSLIRQQAAIGLPNDFFERLLVNGRSCLLLLDGLDEVANERERILVRRAVEELAYNDGAGRVVVTSRSRAYQGQAVLPEEFRLAVVQPMKPEQVNDLAGRWCTAVYDHLEAETETTRLQTAIANLEQLRTARGEARLADTPLLVTIIAIVHYNQRRLPQQRAELYEKCIEVLLSEGHHRASDTTFALADWGGSLPEKRGLLAYVAYEMMGAGEETGRSVNERQMETWLRPQLTSRYGETQAETQLNLFIQAMRERGSLLHERGGAYQFTHLTFQEFLAAYYLAETVRDPQKIVALLTQHGRFANAWWRETILLTVGYLGMKSMDTALALLQVMAVLPMRDEAALAAAELAGTTFLELESQDAGIKTAIIQQLVDLLTARNVMAAPIVRLLGGDALGRLGDPRPGVCTLEPEMIPIPAGPFMMGEEPYEVTIAQPFAIARYPVTNAQYRLFVKDGGYTKKWRHCWTEEGWQYRQEYDCREPRYWNDPGFMQANQPVVGVSWYEAVAYAYWLAAKTGKPYRLPTETEWERAARHTDSRTYPWGNDWQDGLANTKEAGLERPSAVGVFPQDTAVCGAQDIVGNVNQWCQTRWQDEKGQIYSLPYQANDGREKLNGDGNVWRVIRGGSWIDERNWSRCAARDADSPLGGYGYRGVRLVLSPFDSGL